MSLVDYWNQHAIRLLNMLISVTDETYNPSNSFAFCRDVFIATLELLFEKQTLIF